jgi:hypothetical protein
MRIIKTATILASAGIMSLALGGMALADSNSTVAGPTGPNSSTTTTVNTTDTNTTQNTNNVNITNVTTQNATSGNADSSFNTEANGGATTGSASNSSTTETVVSLNNSPVTIVPVVTPGMGSGTPPPTGQTSSQTPAVVEATQVSTPGKGNMGSGSAPTAVLASATTTLPKTGASVPVNTAAIAGNVSGSPLDTTAVKKTDNLSTLVLVTAGLLSFVGALGSAYYANKKSLRV